MYRILRYFTRPMLIAADAERKAANIPDRHAHPELKKLPKKGRYVVTMAYPFLMKDIPYNPPHVECFIVWAEGGIGWYMDVTVERYAKLPKFTEENPHAYRRR